MLRFVSLFAILCLVACSKPDETSMNQTQATHITIPNPDFQGHRGARGLLPENTVPSFIRALELGVTTLELDLVVSRDSQLVVSHEPWFNPDISSHPDGSHVQPDEAKSLNIFLMYYSEVRKYDVGMRGNPRFPEQSHIPVYKPTLEEVVKATEKWIKDQKKPQVWYNIETKSNPAEYDDYYPQPDTFAELLNTEIIRLGIQNRTIVQSFDPNTLIALREINPDLTQALLIENQDSPEVNLDCLGYLPDIYSPYYQLVTKELVDFVHKNGMRIIPWTINDTSEMQRLLDLGVDGIITDYPDRIPR